MTQDGDLDYSDLEKKLFDNKVKNTLKVCSISAGSNLNGIIFDVDRIAVMCHKAGFISCFDYAATCPYNEINMNGPTLHNIESFKELT